MLYYALSSAKANDSLSQLRKVYGVEFFKGVRRQVASSASIAFLQEKEMRKVGKDGKVCLPSKSCHIFGQSFLIVSTNFIVFSSKK